MTILGDLVAWFWPFSVSAGATKCTTCTIGTYSNVSGVWCCSVLAFEGIFVSWYATKCMIMSLIQQRVGWLFVVYRLCGEGAGRCFMHRQEL